MKDLKVGDKIIAIDPCYKTLTVDKEYSIIEIVCNGIIIKDDKGWLHKFSFEKLNKYFNLPETEQPGKFYPFAEEVEMMVWDDMEKYAVKRTVFGRKNGRFVAWDENPYYIVSMSFKNAKPLPPTVTVTMQEIAEWKGVDVEQIKVDG